MFKAQIWIQVETLNPLKLFVSTLKHLGFFSFYRININILIQNKLIGTCFPSHLCSSLSIKTRPVKVDLFYSHHKLCVKRQQDSEAK